MHLQDDIQKIKGIGEKSAVPFHKAGIYTVEDLLRYYPRDYEALEDISLISNLEDGEIFTICARVIKLQFEKKIGRLTMTSFLVADESGTMTLKYYNMPYMKKVLTGSSIFCFRGRVAKKGTSFVMDHPVHYAPEEYDKLKGALLPIYPLVKGLTQKALRKAFAQVLPLVSLHEIYPEGFLEYLQILEGPVCDEGEAIKGIHNPLNQEMLFKCRNRLVFDEFLRFLVQVREMKNQSDEEPNEFPMIPVAQTHRFLEALPFSLTDDQKKAWEEIENDMSSETRMNRLIQGDVGSGKTILAFLALLMCVSNGYQGAMMAPTEVLAKQHFQTLVEYTKAYKLPFVPLLLTGSLTAKQKREAYERILTGEVNVIIGTHALFQEKVEYKNLGLIITDEQHRFGVVQRQTLSEKGTKNPHVCVMSATPIPRTLAMILYGDLHISLIKQMPSGRKPIKNAVVGTKFRPKSYAFIASQVEMGRQAFVICPMIEKEEEDAQDLENVMDYAKKLREALPNTVSVGILHGKMKPSVKDEIMTQFADGVYDVLVSTTVIEVGINVPNATVMMVENAERFGLAQLHQLRGRVGRGEYESYCIFVNTKESENSKKRLDVLAKSNDGFYIAEEDLKLRGPGDLFGIRQSGELFFHLADIYRDAELLAKADKACAYLYTNNRIHTDLAYTKMKEEMVKKGEVRL